jgi:hypothetical protein
MPYTYLRAMIVSVHFPDSQCNLGAQDSAKDGLQSVSPNEVYTGVHAAFMCRIQAC